MEAVVRRCSEKDFNFIKKEALTWAFSCEFCKISKNTFLYRAPPVAASVTYDNTAPAQLKKDVDRSLKHNLARVFFDIFASKARVQSLYILFGRD